MRPRREKIVKNGVFGVFFSGTFFGGGQISRDVGVKFLNALRNGGKKVCPSSIPDCDPQSGIKRKMGSKMPFFVKNRKKVIFFFFCKLRRVVELSDPRQIDISRGGSSVHNFFFEILLENNLCENGPSFGKKKLTSFFFWPKKKVRRLSLKKLGKKT